MSREESRKSLGLVSKSLLGRRLSPRFISSMNLLRVWDWMRRFPSFKFACTHFIHLGEENRTVRDKCLSRDQNRCPRPGLEPRPLDQESSELPVSPRIPNPKSLLWSCHTGKAVMYLWSKRLPPAALYLISQRTASPEMTAWISSVSKVTQFISVKRLPQI